MLLPAPEASMNVSEKSSPRASEKRLVCVCCDLRMTVPHFKESCQEFVISNVCQMLIIQSSGCKNTPCFLYIKRISTVELLVWLNPYRKGM